MLRQRAAQRSLALPCELEQIVVIKPEQRALQRHRQRQVVLRQQQCVREVHQIDDRDVLGQLEAVGAGDRDTRMLQRLDHGIERVAAPPHQHQHVAIAQRTAVAFAARHHTAADQRLDLGLNAPGKLHFGAGRGDAVERCAPAFDVLPVVRFREFPEIDLARACVGQRMMDRISDIDRMNAAKDILLAKHLIDRMQDRRPLYGTVFRSIGISKGCSPSRSAAGRSTWCSLLGGSGGIGRGFRRDGLKILLVSSPETPISHSALS